MSLQQERHLLPEGFTPSPDDVVIGRGRKIVARNARFYKIIEREMHAYAAATSKALKSLILVRVLQHVKEVSKGKFVKKDGDRWLEVEDSLSRTTIAQALRDALHTTYRSSKQFKQRRRKQAKVTTSPPPSSDCKPSAAGAPADMDESAMTALLCARMVHDQRRRATPEKELSAQFPHEELRDVFALESPTSTKPMKSLHDILNEVEGMCLGELPGMVQDQAQPRQEEVMESLDGAFSLSEIEAACDDDLEISSSLFTSKSEGNNFRAPLVESWKAQGEYDEEFDVLDELDVQDIRAAFAA